MNKKKLILSIGLLVSHNLFCKTARFINDTPFIIKSIMSKKHSAFGGRDNESKKTFPWKSSTIKGAWPKGIHIKTIQLGEDGYTFTIPTNILRIPRDGGGNPTFYLNYNISDDKRKLTFQLKEGHKTPKEYPIQIVPGFAKKIKTARAKTLIRHLGDAVIANKLSIIKNLLSRKIGIHEKVGNNSFLTLLLLKAIENKNLTISKLLLKYGANPEEIVTLTTEIPMGTMKTLTTPLYEAVRKNDYDITSFLVAMNANPHQTYTMMLPNGTSYKETPLELAKRKGYTLLLPILERK